MNPEGSTDGDDQSLPEDQDDDDETCTPQDIFRPRTESLPGDQ